MFWNLSQREFKILIGIQIISLGGLSYAEDYCTGLAPLSDSISTKFFSGKGKDFYGMFRAVIVHRNLSVSKEHPEIFFLIYAAG